MTKTVPDGANTINVETISYLDSERKETRTDANLHTSEMVYDGLHRLVSLTNADGKTRQLKYDGRNLRSESDYKGRFTRYEYDNVDRPTKVVDRLGDGQATITEHNDSSGYTKTITDRRANKRVEKSDAIGRLLSITDGGLPLMSYEYDAGSNRTAATDGEGHRTEMVYDVLNRLKLKKNGAGSAAEQSETYSYDAAGNLTDYYDERGGHIIQAFDPLNQLKSRKDGEGNETLFNYDGEGLLNWQREPKGFQTSYVYNSLRSLKSVTNAKQMTWTFVYDAAQNLKSVVDPRTFVTNYDYDNLDRLTKVTQPLGKITLNEYDNNSNKTKITDPNGQITQIVPDDLDRVDLVKHYKAGGAIERLIDYQLDGEGNAFQIDEQITDGATQNRSYSRQFDQRNRLIQTTDYRNKTVRFDYDKANNVTLITDAASKRTGYVYDEQNRVKTVTTNDGESIVYNWYKDGLLKDVNYKNGLKREYSYDNADRVSSIKNTVGVNAQGTQTQEFIYGYDPNSNRLNETRRTDGATSKQLAFNYDELNRLTLSTETTPAPTTQPPPGQSINVTENSLLTGNGYDAVGNRDGITTQTKVRTITRTANGQGEVTETSTEQAGQISTATAQFDALNRLTNLSENNVNTAFAYDNNGNLLSETIAGTVQKRYEYDTRDQLKKVFAGASNQIAGFDYDFNRHRTSKQAANTNLHYVYAGDEVVDEFDSSSGLLPLHNRYEIGAGEIVKGELRNEPTNYYFSDALGSTTNLSQLNGAQSFSTSTSEYDSFGKVNNQTGASANSIGYTGQRLDTETGLMALGNGERYYSPQLARFTQQDSFTGMTAMPQSLNRYSYSYNNPFRFHDPSGNASEDVNEQGFYRSGYLQQEINNRKEFWNNHSDGSWSDFRHAFMANLNQTVYNIVDGAAGNLHSRQDRLQRNHDAGKITAFQFVEGTAVNAAISPQLAVLNIAAPVAGGVLGAAGGAAVGNVPGGFAGAFLGAGTGGALATSAGMYADDQFNSTVYGDAFHTTSDYLRAAGTSFVLSGVTEGLPIGFAARSIIKTEGRVTTQALIEQTIGGNSTARQTGNNVTRSVEDYMEAASERMAGTRAQYEGLGEYGGNSYGSYRSYLMDRLNNRLELRAIGEYRIAFDTELGKEVGLGTLDDGYLKLAIYSKETGTKLRGSEIFKGIYDKFHSEGQEIKGIFGLWSKTSDNTATFNQKILEGILPEKAALETFTGKMAARKGYTNVTIDYNKSVRNADSTFESVQALFEK